MRLGLIFKYIGGVLLLNAAFMLVSAAISWANGMDSGFTPLILSCVLTFILGFFPSIFVRKKAQINAKEGYCIVTGAWLLCCLVGTFPYLMYGGEFTVINAWFESVSGFTTTGSTILADVEALPRSLLFWRATTHWIGGVGVVMFALAVLPALGNTRKMLYNVELSPMAKDNFRYKTPKIIRILLMVYIGITVSETVLLRTAGMDWFDAVTHSFSTVATGGFSTRNASIAAFDSFWIEQIITFFTLVSGLHFGLIYATLLGSRNNIFRSEITRFYFLTVAAATLLITFSLWHDRIYPTFWESLRQSLFQSVTMISTTGFATADTNLWTPLAMLILIWLSIQCACAGSTTGGIKCDRVLLAFKTIRAMMIRRQHPNAVIRVKLNGVILEQSVVDMAMLFIVFYLMLLALGTIVVAAFGMDLETSFSMTASCMANAGVGFGKAGSMSNYHDFPGAIKYICTVFMLLGRLEIFGLLQLFVTNWWK